MRIVFLGDPLKNTGEPLEYNGHLAEDVRGYTDLEEMLSDLSLAIQNQRFLIFVGSEFSPTAQKIRDFTISKSVMARVFMNKPATGFKLDTNQIFSFDFRNGAFSEMLSRIEKQIFRLSGMSEFMRKLREDLVFFAFSDSNLFLTGETGTGKSLVAQISHSISHRSGNRFLELNCANVPEELLESELFGHTKGAFTGAYSDKHGLLEETDNGSLFLDEIGEMSQHVQSKLLTAIEIGRFLPIGSNSEINVDVRLFTATNQDPKGRLRLDLYHRLSELKIDMIPLRERKDDIPFLINNFLYNSGYTITFEEFPPEVKRAFIGHEYRGNIRELRNIVTRFVEFSESPVDENVPSNYDPNAFAKNELTERFVASMVDLYMAESEPLNEMLDKIHSRLESEIVKHVLNACKWNKTAAAKKLLVSRRTIDNLIKRYDIDRRKKKMTEKVEDTKY